MSSAKIRDLDLDVVRKLQQEVRDGKDSFQTYEELAHDFSNRFYRKFKDSIVLARIFLTVPYARLPESNKAFVDKIVEKNSIQHLLHDNTLILSLVGSAGEEAAWMDRSNSENHIGIPLISADFIDKAPMMSRLLKELGLNLEYISSDDTYLVKHTLGRMNGMFYVREASSEVDIKGRKIIADQNFVEQYDVKTVMGFGGGYSGDYPFYTAIIFLREEIEAVRARLVAAELSFFKIVTLKAVKGQIFKD